MTYKHTCSKKILSLYVLLKSTLLHAGVFIFSYLLRYSLVTMCFICMFFFCSAAKLPYRIIRKSEVVNVFT